MFLILCLGVAVVALAAAVWVRLAPMPADVWHVDPAGVTPPARPNYDLRLGARAPVFDAPPAVIAARLDAVASAERAKIIAGDPALGHVTYVARSRIMGFPDAVSVRLVPVAGGTRAEFFSRARFGHSDLGVNQARLDRWVDAIRTQTSP